MFSFDHSKVDMKEVLGKGAFGSVYPYRSKPDDNRFVVKWVKTQDFRTAALNIQEIVLAFSCDHPNILSVRGFHLDFDPKKQKWDILMKLPRMKTSLNNLYLQRMKKQEYFTEEELVKYFYGIVCGLKYLHDKKIAHRDIKLENVLLDDQNQVKISDVGVAKYVGDETSLAVNEIAGSLQYMAPEVKLAQAQKIRKKDLYKSDLWSLGIVMAKLCHLDRGLEYPVPFGPQYEAKLIYGLSKIRRYSQDFVQVILNLLQVDSSKRRSTDELKQILESKFGHIIQKMNMEVKKEENVPKSQEAKIEEKKIESDGDISSLISSQKEDFKEIKVPDISEELKTTMETIRKDLEETWTKIFDVSIRHQEVPILTISSMNPKKIAESTVSELMENIGKQLETQNLPEIPGFSMTLQYCEVNDAALKSLIAGLKDNFKKISHLELVFWNCSKIDDDAIKTLATQIGNNHPSLISLSLSFQECKDITDEGIKGLVTEISSKMKDLKQIQFNFNKCKKITNQSVKDLINQIGSLDLTSLELFFAWCDKIDNEGVKELAMGIAKHLQNLQNLKLSLSNSAVKDEGISELGHQIEANLKKLNTVSISLFNTAITEKAKTSLRSSLRQIKNHFIEFES